MFTVSVCMMFWSMEEHEPLIYSLIILVFSGKIGFNNVNSG